MGQSPLRIVILRRKGLTLLGLLCIIALLLTTNNAGWVRAQSGTASGNEEPSEEDLQGGPPAPWDVDSIQPLQQPQGITAAAATDCFGLQGRQVRYTSDGVIHVEGCRQVFTLTQVLAELPPVLPGKYADKKDLLELVDPANKIWFLKTKLKVEEGATLNVIGGAAGDANWLRLRSDNTSGIWLRSDNGNIRFENTKVTSWDATKGSVDTDYSYDPATGTGNGRSYIAVRSVLTRGRTTAPPTACNVNGGTQEPYEARMDVINSELSYLGYYAAEAYGVVWKVYYKASDTDPTDTPPPGRQLYAMVDVFGNVINSKVLHNYFGVYTFGGYCMNFTGSEYAENVKYGLDPHDDSDYLLIDNNLFHDNGNHGVICSQFCNDLVITNNKSWNNSGGDGTDGTDVPYTHGIMLHRSVTNSLVENNDSYNNSGGGIAVFESHNNIIRNNRVWNNGQAALRLSVGAASNLFESNILIGPPANASGSGYVVYTYKGADLPIAGDGRPKNNIFRNNQMTAYKSPVLKLGEASGNVFENNIITGPLTEYELKNATGNIIRNSEPGKAIDILLDSTSTVSFEDTRNNIWMLPETSLSTTAATGRTTLDLTFTNAGPTESITTLDLTVRPSAGTIMVEPAIWQTNAPYRKTWTERASATPGVVAHQVGNLQALACYDVVANGIGVGRFTADDTGRIAFLYNGSYNGVVSFGVAAAPNCNGANPALRRTFLPTMSK